MKLIDHRNIRRIVVESQLLGPSLELDPNGSEEEVRKWNQLLDKLAETELKAAESSKGASNFFSQLADAVGKKKGYIDPWVCLIPNEYGLCVVKSALLILLQLAQRHSDKRQKIIDGFLELRKVISDATAGNPQLRSFQTDPQVSKSAGSLYVTVVDAIEGLLEAFLALAPPTSSKWFPKLRRTKSKSQPNEQCDVAVIMQKLHSAVKEFEASVNSCRDSHIQTTSTKVKEVLDVTVATTTQIGHMNEQMSEWFENIAHCLTKNSQGVEALQEQGVLQHETLLKLQEMIKTKEDATAGLVALYDEQVKKNKAMKARLARKDRELRELQRYRSSQPASTGEAQSSKATISLGRLLRILSAPTPDRIYAENNKVNLEDLLAHCERDLETVLSWGSRIEPNAQAQAYSMFDKDRFFRWMRSEDPDMLLVDGNLFVRGAVSLEKISAMSLVCANLVLSLSSLDPSAVLLHFHCGLHSNPDDDWYGPVGLVRSMIVQLLAILYDKDQLDLNILNRRSFAKALESHILDDLCALLHQLMDQLPPDTAIFIIIDGICWFDLDARGSYRQLMTVLDGLRSIVEDDNLRPTFKVLMTSPTKSSWRLGNAVDNAYRLGLPLSRLGPLRISQGRVARSLSGE
ncbi:hypothetical protein M440DRAFT_1324433 [Trichoderma longibrachiatum ATCC 18648]|uniref:Fungal STAND N-terminal Goodbye domain-containing protein n=1 Tax=Trichoderma longibrachiatum ATCC 18648 TaxID=983965 RepID=A0A2T4CGP2_TRILO|nr:hypothetical protein M440DRAFT_1324433 [Trichoderma longibrachiatum ATCC 18648]